MTDTVKHFEEKDRGTRIERTGLLRYEICEDFLEEVTFENNLNEQRTL